MQSIKSRVTDWVTQQIRESYIDSEIKSLKDRYLIFRIIEFCDEPEIFLSASSWGLEWGYDTFIWKGPHTPIPTKRITRKLSWETLKSMNDEQKKEKIIAEMLKAVASKKREYLRCKYCKNKMHSNEFYDNNTCKVCAGEHLGIFIVH